MARAGLELWPARDSSYGRTGLGLWSARESSKSAACSQSHHGLHVILQQFVAERELSGKKALKGVVQDALAKCWITFYTCLNRFSEIPR